MSLEFLRSVTPQDASELVDYFDSTYVRKRLIATTTRQNRRIPNSFLPSVWNVNKVTLNDGQRTNH